MQHGLGSGIGGVRKLLFDADRIGLTVPVHDDIAARGAGQQRQDGCGGEKWCQASPCGGFIGEFLQERSPS